MKILCIVLSLAVSVLSGVLAFTVRAGHPPMVEAVETEGVADVQPEAAPNPVISSQIGLVDELVEALQVSHEELNTAKLRLDKREKNLQELYSSYLKLRQETNLLISELDNRLVKVSKEELKNFKKLSSVYSNMDPSSAAQSLKHMDAERVALILSQMDGRAMAAIMDSAVSTSVNGSEFVAQWSDAIRRLNDTQEGVK